MSSKKNEARSTNPVLASYMKELGAHDTLTREEEEVKSFKELDQRVRDCAKVLAMAPERFFKNWAGEGDAPQDGDQHQDEDPDSNEDGDGSYGKFKSESVQAAHEIWMARKDPQELMDAVMVDGEAREWATITINAVLSNGEVHAGCGPWIQKLRVAQRRYAALRERIVSANLRLVVHMMKQFHKEGRHMHRLDLIQEGNIGLMRAVERFEVDRGYRFSTYAMWWIRHHIQRGLAEKDRGVRLPVHIVDAMNKIGAFIQRQVAQGLPTDDMTISKGTGIALEKVQRVLLARTTYVSMDAKIGEHEESSYADLIEDSKVRPPTEGMESAQLRRDLKEVLETLPEAERTVILMRFHVGEKTDEMTTLAEIGSRFNRSRERIRQLESQALRRMNVHSRHLRHHLNNQ